MTGAISTAEIGAELPVCDVSALITIVGKADPGQTVPLRAFWVCAESNEKSLSRCRLRSTSGAKEALLLTVDGSSWVAAPPGPKCRACGGATAASGTDRPPASTKRAMLIGMLERAEGTSVTEIGQRLGWLPHTVRAAITGLRHAGREVARGKDQSGQSVYRLVRVETIGR